MLLDPSFWGSQGRVALVRSGEHQGQYAFIYPETRSPWWTVSVDPRPDEVGPIEMYIEGTDELEWLLGQWNLSWVPRDQDEVIEKERFGQRPLLGGPSWTELL